jgi:predicted nucleic acid-binding protein
VLVLDASVLVELVVDGRHRAAADRLLDRYATEPALVLVTAAHGLVEAASAVRGLVRRQELTDAEGAAAIAWLADLHVVLDASSPRLRRVWELRDRMSAHDAAYAAAAEALELPLLSTDGRLLAACAAAGIEARHLDDVRY